MHSPFSSIVEGVTMKDAEGDALKSAGAISLMSIPAAGPVPRKHHEPRSGTKHDP